MRFVTFIGSICSLCYGWRVLLRVGHTHIRTCCLRPILGDHYLADVAFNFHEDFSLTLIHSFTLPCKYIHIVLLPRCLIEIRDSSVTRLKRFPANPKPSRNLGCGATKLASGGSAPGRRQNKQTTLTSHHLTTQTARSGTPVAALLHSPQLAPLIITNRNHLIILLN